MSPAAGWIVLAVVLAVFGGLCHCPGRTPARARTERAAPVHRGPQDRRNRGGRDPARLRLQPQPRAARPAQGRPLGRPVRVASCSSPGPCCSAARARALHLRHRRQPRGGAPGRHQRVLDPHDGLHALRPHRRHGRARLRVAPRLDGHRHRRRLARPVRRGRGGHRRREPVRRAGQADPRAARRGPHRGRVQRSRSAGHQRRRPGHRNGDRAPRGGRGRFARAPPRGSTSSL